VESSIIEAGTDFENSHLVLWLFFDLDIYVAGNYTRKYHRLPF